MVEVPVSVGIRQVVERMHNLRNSRLRTLAIVEAQLTKGLQRPSEYIVPFFQYVLAKNKDMPFDIKQVVEEVENNFGLRVPIYIAESLIPILLETGALVTADHTNVRMCAEWSSNDEYPEINQSHFDLLEQKLTNFAKTLDVEKPLSCDTWQEAIISFFSEPESPGKVVKMNNNVIPNGRARDNWLISKFVLQEQLLGSDVFDLIKRIFIGFSVADTVSKIQLASHTDDWSGLTVFYDATVLMRLLGTSGKLLKDATMEMHTLLCSIGCKTMYFQHILSEVFGNFDMLSNNIAARQAIHKETQAALEENSISVSEILLMKGDADRRLEKIGIYEFEMPARRITNAVGQISPDQLQDYLINNIRYRGTGRDAAAADAESIENVMFLRKGKRHTELPKSEFLFVTHNSRFAWYASKFCLKECGYKERNVSPIVTLNTLTRIVWIASENDEGISNMSNQLIMNCYASALPDEQWSAKFWNAIENTSPELLEIDTVDSLYLLDVRNMAENTTLGSASLFEKVDIPTIMQRVKEEAESRVNSHLQEKEDLMKKSDNDLNALRAAQKERLKIFSAALRNNERNEKEKAVLRSVEDIKDRLKSNARIHASKATTILIMVIVATLCSIYFYTDSFDVS